MVKKHILLWVRCLIVSASLALLGTQTAQAVTLGQTVTNVASVSYDQPGGGQLTVLTNPAEFVIEAARTQSTIEFFRYAPNAPDAISVQLNGADYAPGGQLGGPFTAMPAPERTPGHPIDISGPVPLVPASTYFSGELMFVHVEDLGQNGDPNRIETIEVTIETDSGDSIVLRLYESGPDTGQFWGWVPSNRDNTPQNDPVLTTPQGTDITATYVDSFDSSEVSVDTALVDPYGRVFNGLTGELVDGARVTLINAATGQPANVYGIDGVSSYPSTVVSGQDVTDSGGLVYDLRPGEFRFPLVPQGQYYIQVEAPEGLSFASVLSPADFVGLDNAPFVIETDASYGQQFTLAGTAPLNFDIPLDAQSTFVVNKSSTLKFADVGDFVPFTVSVENNGTAGAAVVLVDTLPQGFRYVQGSSKRDGQKLADPQISTDGHTLTFKPGALRVGEKLELTYVAEVGAGVRKGESFNTIVARDGQGRDVSNKSRAGITLREDLLRSTSTLVGRVAEKACAADQDWARDLKDGKGVAGVRLYMETGAYAITDQDGLYNFQGIKNGTHVVQIDEETLPKGYEVMMCEENSRYGGSAISKFVEIQGGNVWRANFYLRQTGEVRAGKEDKQFNDRTEYKQYDSHWLGTQTADIAWVYPDPTRTPSIPSLNIGIKHGANQRVALSLNGRPVPMENFESMDSDASRTVLISRWKGVDLLAGKNVFTALVKDAKGQTVGRLSREIYYVENIMRASALPDQSVLVADGRTKPVLAVRLEDEAGRPVHAGRIAKIDVVAPYRLYNKSRLQGEEELVAPNSALAQTVVGPDGIVRLELEPTLQTGKVTIHVTLDDGRERELFMYLAPEKRDWIIVGLAEGSVAYNRLTNKAKALAAGERENLTSDGRVAFFAKGLIKGNWLLTLAVDTDKRRGARDGDFRGEIDPNAYYTLYGDRSYNAFEAQSRYPVYVKLEKKTFYAMFGDFDTNITEGKLTRYNRHLSGIKSEYLGANFQAIGYAAQTNQGFARDEIAAAGTSGPYWLSNVPVLANSETITIETRDRVRPDVILAKRRLIRHLDYTLDNLTGEIIFRLPVDATDSGFNPNVIVVDYETSSDAERNLSWGGRVQKQILDGKVQIGSTFVHEGGDGNMAGGRSDMIGGEVIAKLAPGTEVRGEYAYSRTKQTNGDYKGSTAYLAEIIHTSDKLTAGAYIRSEEAGYGLRQRSTTTSAVRRYGADISYKFSEFENKKTGRRGNRILAASAYREENLGTGSNRTASEVTITQDSERLGASLGLRGVTDNLANGTSRRSVLALIRARYTLPRHGVTFQASREQALGGRNSVDDYPTRTRLSVEKTITDRASVRISHDILDGANIGGSNTAIGVKYAPWAGTELTAGSDMITSESGRRIGATIGLDQQFQLGPKWSTSFGVTNRRILGGSGSVIEQVAPDAANSPFELNRSYVAGYVGLGYRTEKTSASGRLEARNGSGSNDFIVSLAAAREMSEKLSFAGALRASFREQTRNGVNVLSGRSKRVDARLGTAWRPRGEGLIFLNRFDLVLDDGISENKTTKLVNNFTANTMLSDRWQLAGHYGLKYVVSDFEGETYKGVSQLLGGETRFDLTDKIDLGLQGSLMFGHGLNSWEYAYGPSIGVTPVKNVWLSLGYNVVGYREEDFAAAEYARQGVYLKFRFKFDQNTARGLLNMITPEPQTPAKRP